MSDVQARLVALADEFVSRGGADPQMRTTVSTQLATLKTICVDLGWDEPLRRIIGVERAWVAVRP